MIVLLGIFLVRTALAVVCFPARALPAASHALRCARLPLPGSLEEWTDLWLGLEAV